MHFRIISFYRCWCVGVCEYAFLFFFVQCIRCLKWSIIQSVKKPLFYANTFISFLFCLFKLFSSADAQDLLQTKQNLCCHSTICVCVLCNQVQSMHICTSRFCCFCSFACQVPIFFCRTGKKTISLFLLSILIFHSRCFFFLLFHIISFRPFGFQYLALDFRLYFSLICLSRFSMLFVSNTQFNFFFSSQLSNLYVFCFVWF